MFYEIDMLSVFDMQSSRNCNEEAIKTLMDSSSASCPCGFILTSCDAMSYDFGMAFQRGSGAKYY